MSEETAEDPGPAALPEYLAAAEADHRERRAQVAAERAEAAALWVKTQP